MTEVTSKPLQEVRENGWEDDSWDDCRKFEEGCRRDVGAEVRCRHGGLMHWRQGKLTSDDLWWYWHWAKATSNLEVQAPEEFVTVVGWCRSMRTSEAENGDFLLDSAWSLQPMQLAVGRWNRVSIHQPGITVIKWHAYEFLCLSTRSEYLSKRLWSTATVLTRAKSTHEHSVGEVERMSLMKRPALDCE